MTDSKRFWWGYQGESHDEAKLARKILKKTRRARYMEMHATLACMFPSCFKNFEQTKLPLKIGIHEDLLPLMPDDRRCDVLNAVHNYVNSSAYLTTMVVGASRVDLDGNPCGAVTDIEASDAMGKLLKVKRENAKDKKNADARGRGSRKSNQGVAASGLGGSDGSGSGRHRYHDEVMAGQLDSLEANATPRDRGGSQITEHTNA